jgi:hypothetical protein
VSAVGAGLLPCCDSEGQVLRIPASIAAGVVADLRDGLAVDAANITMVAQAMLRSGRAP